MPGSCKMRTGKGNLTFRCWIPVIARKQAKSFKRGSFFRSNVAVFLVPVRAVAHFFLDLRVIANLLCSYIVVVNAAAAVVFALESLRHSLTGFE